MNQLLSPREVRSAIVTGAGGGIGGGIAEGLARTGVVVGVADNRMDAATATVERIKAEGGQAYPIEVNVADAASVKAMFGASDRGEVPPVDLLVNNAAVLRRAKLEEGITAQTEHDLSEILDVNVKGSYWCLSEAAKRMSEVGFGNIINIASGSGFRGSRGRDLAPYHVSKGAVRLLTLAAAAELADFGIRVNAVAPGSVHTGFGTAHNIEANRLATAAATPIPRLGTPEDMADAVIFLASPKASFITGHILVVDGGRLAF